MSMRRLREPEVLRLRGERRRRRWSLTHVSGLTGIAAADLSVVERGLRYPHPGWRRRLAAAFELPEEELFAPADEEAESR
jgi:transcriptional regulator with XRE-family HTH domain